LNLRLLCKQGVAGSIPATSTNSFTSKTIVKLIDKYNYARFTKGWI